MAEPAPVPPATDAALVAALRRRDEAAFTALVDRYSRTLHRLAQLYLRDAAAAEDVVQETWLGVLRGIDGFEGRAAFKTWLCRILVNRAKTRAVRDGRTVPFSQLGDRAEDPGESAVPAERFRGPDDPFPGHWRADAVPHGWGADPETQLLAAEAQALIRAEIDRLPPGQRAVITLRDGEGWASTEVCNVLGISETNQRVLLHRARARVRLALERYFTPG